MASVLTDVLTDVLPALLASLTAFGVAALSAVAGFGGAVLLTRKWKVPARG